MTTVPIDDLSTLTFPIPGDDKRAVGVDALPPICFLDIDGVLNTHDANADYICGIHADKVDRLNMLVHATDAEIVISSAWRYMMLSNPPAMTIDGFRYMLTTHGLRSFVKIVGHTKSDEQIAERGDQITDFLRTFGWRRYVILDDGAESTNPLVKSMSESIHQRHGERWVKVDGAVGFTESDLVLATAIALRPL